MTDEELLLWLFVVLVTIGLFAVIELLLNTMVSALLLTAIIELFVTIVFSLKREKTERYEKIFENWVKEGNLLFKVKGSVYIYCKRYYEGIFVIVGFLVFDNEGGCYEYKFHEDVVGKAIFKNRLPERYVHKATLTKDEFVGRLIDADSKNKIHGNVFYPFSFGKIDLNELPDWLVAALVERKLSE